MTSPPGGRGRRPPPRRTSPPRRGRPTARSSSFSGLGGEQVEGRRAVRELLAAGRRRVREVVLADDLDPAPVLEEIAILAAAARVPLRRVSRPRLEALAVTGAPQGVVARAEPLEEHPLEDLSRRRAGGPAPFLLVLDGVTDPQNLGALLRTAECAGVTGAVLPRHRAAHVTPAVTKAAAGAIERVPLCVVPGVPAALARLRELRVWIVGLDPAGDEEIFALQLAAEPIALVLGAEGGGLSRLAKARCDVLVRIPVAGALASLNVAAAGAVACFQVARGRRT